MLANNLIRLLVSVAILAAVYLFAIRPILDTTNDAIDRAFNATDGIQQDIQKSFDDAGVAGFDAKSLTIKGNSTSSTARKAEKLLHCVRKVQPDTTKMQACVDRYQG